MNKLETAQEDKIDFAVATIGGKIFATVDDYLAYCVQEKAEQTTRSRKKHRKE